MSKVEEIEAAIRSLSPDQRQELVKDLPSILPELDGDAAWDRILEDARARPALSVLADRIEADSNHNPQAYPSIRESDFD
jgi:hypothetical protein